MSFEVDEEILQDFLVEAGEILEQLSEQLVDLEQNPEDKPLLNAIFRGFHTVKGGAGFLQLTPLVDCCHYAENVFDILRNGQREVTSELMDVVLQALDAVNEMFDAVRAGVEPEKADPEIITALSRYASPPSEDEGIEDADEIEEVEDEISTDSVDDAAESPSEDSVDITDDEFESLLSALGSTSDDSDSSDSASSSDEITEDEFESLLDQLHGSSADVKDDPTVSDAPQTDDITEEEFEQLLDTLHGDASVDKNNSSIKESDNATTENVDINSSDENETSNLITDDEFENLLDSLHGKGKGPIEGSDSEPAKEPSPKAKAKAKPKSTEKPKPASKPVAKVESEESPAKEKASAPVVQETTVRVDTKRLDDIMNMVGELVLVRNRLVRLGLQSDDESMGKAVSNLDVVTGDLQNAVMKTRMQPIKKVFGRFPRVVRDLARNMKKEVNLELRGEDTDLDKNLVEALADPLVHLVRNSVDHGVEGPDVREANGKPRMGHVILAAEQEGDHILLSIEDDGAGMDADKLREKAVEKGLMDADAAERLSDNEAFNLIFAPGFSTKVEITDVSGRGVGMDVVKTKISQLNGTLDIKSVLGKGSRFSIKVPLTLAIMPTLMVMLEDQAFAFPLVSVNEIFHLNLKKTNVVNGQQVVVIRGKTLPIFHMKNWLVKGKANDDAPEDAHVVVVQVGINAVGFVVDQLVGQEEVVIKPLGRMLQGTAGMAGATITGDGRIALILDVPSMLKNYASTH
ncbi:chemotaxis protein CheA [Marinomonas sp. 2405UD68-3]|uniref:chemotaxis protein CheA n=1 Tax=Marinomonas sp. 2405UD68-3 TaxID=3391835 RepID=UPI0039C92441